MQLNRSTSYFYNGCKLLALLFLISCNQKIGNQVNQTLLDCGVDSLDDAYKYVKVFDSQGNSIDSAVMRTASTMARDSDGSKTSTAITSRGCMRVEKSSQLAFVSVSGLKEAGVKILDSSTKVEKLRLEAFPEVKPEVSCKNGGIYANDEAENPFEVQILGSGSTLRTQVFANEVNGTGSYTLYDSDFLTGYKGLPKKLNTAGIPSGHYRLYLQYFNPSLGWEAASLNLNGGKECILTVIHEKPKGSVKFHEIRVKTKQRLNIAFEEDETEPVYCFRPIKGTALCEAKSSCLNEDENRKSVINSPDEEGVFELWTKVQDKAGNSSSESCHPIVVTNRAPEIDLKWTDDRFNVDQPSFDLPRGEIAANISTTHSDLSLEEQQANTQCRVDFLLNGMHPVLGESVLCASGACKSKPMDNYVPCSGRINLDVRKAWTIPGFQRSRPYP